MISWMEYIKPNILEFRKRRLTKKEKELTIRSKKVFHASLFEPCQIVVIDFHKPHPTCFVILHIADHQDMDVVALEKVSLEDLSFRTLKKVRLLESFSPKEIREITKDIKKLSSQMVHFEILSAWEVYEKSALLLHSHDLRFSHMPFDFSNCVYNYFELTIEDVVEERQRKKIEKTVGDILRDAKTIEEAELRDRIIETTEKLEGQVGQLGEQQRKLREEMVGVRRLMGTKTFGEWKTLLSEIDKVNTRIEANVRRLDEKIDKGLEAINTRIEDLKAIKFWSKRTLLEIALAIWGAIVTLIATGILEF